jgi:G3E family GTPase
MTVFLRVSAANDERACTDTVMWIGRTSRKASANRAREGRFDYLLVGSTGVPEPLPAAETRLGRRTALTFSLLPPPQKN